MNLIKDHYAPDGSFLNKTNTKKQRADCTARTERGTESTMTCWEGPRLRMKRPGDPPFGIDTSFFSYIAVYIDSYIAVYMDSDIAVYMDSYIAVYMDSYIAVHIDSYIAVYTAM